MLGCLYDENALPSSLVANDVFDTNDKPLRSLLSKADLRNKALETANDTTGKEDNDDFFCADGADVGRIDPHPGHRCPCIF